MIIYIKYKLQNIAYTWVVYTHVCVLVYVCARVCVCVFHVVHVACL